MQEDTRQAPRRRLPSTAVLDSGYGPMEFPILDVSHDGLFLMSDLLIEEGERFSLCFELPDWEAPVRGWGEVVRVQSVDRNPWSGDLHCPGMGVRFLVLESKSADGLMNFVSSCN